MAAFAVAAVYLAALLFGPRGPHVWREMVLQNICFGLIAFYSGLRAVALPDARRWLVPVTGWMGCMFVGNLLINSPDSAGTAVNFWGQVIFLLAYPCALAAVLGVVRGRLRPTGPGQGVEALVSALAIAAISTSFVIGPTVEAVRGRPGTLPIMAFPMFDLLVGTLLILSIALTGAGAERMSGWLALGLAVYASADWRYALGVATNTWVTGHPIDGVWVVGAIFVGLMAPAAHRPHRVGARSGVASFAVSLSAATAGLVVLCVGTQTSLPRTGVAIAAACILATLVRLLLAYRDMRDLATVRVLAATDELTELGNRRALHAALDGATSRGAAVLLLMVDLDGFKRVNDRCGHDVGDALLVQVAERFRRAMPAGACLVRLGGDEFSAVITDHELTKVVDSGRRFAVAVSRIDLPGGLRIGASVGIVDSRHFDGIDRSGLQRRADQAMYTAKRTRVVVHVAHPGDPEESDQLDQPVTGEVPTGEVPIRPRRAGREPAVSRP